MRTIGGDLQAIYDNPVNTMAAFARVDVDRTGSGDWVDLSDYLDVDWVKDVSIQEALDNQSAVATVTLFLTEGEYKNLSPWAAGSPVNYNGTLCDLYNKVRIYTATVGDETLPDAITATDWVLVLEGRIVEHSVNASNSGGTLTLRCETEIEHEMRRIFIEDTKVYGDDGGTDLIEDVIQDILTDNTSFTLYSPNGTGGTPVNGADLTNVAIKEYEQQRVPVMEACKKLADVGGFDLRVRYHANTADFQLVISEPDRANTTADYTFERGKYKINSATKALRNIRNVGRIRYYDQSKRQFTYEDASTGSASITAYGRRFFEITEDASSQIDSSTEASTFITALVKDVMEPIGVYTVTVPYFYVVELGDLIELIADNVISTSDRKLAVRAISHRLSGGQGWTTMTLEGFPASYSASKANSKQERFSEKEIAGRNISLLPGRGKNLLDNGDFGNWTRG